MTNQLWPRGGGGSGVELADSVKGVWTSGVQVARNDIWIKNGYSWVALEDIENSTEAPSDLLTLPAKQYANSSPSPITPEVIGLPAEKAGVGNGPHYAFVLDVITAGTLRISGPDGFGDVYLRTSDANGGYGGETQPTQLGGTGQYMIRKALPVGRFIGLAIRLSVGPILLEATEGLVVATPSVKWAKLGTLVDA